MRIDYHTFMKRKEIKQIVGKVSEGIISSTTNLLFYFLFLTGASLFQSPNSRGVYQAFTEADEMLKEINYQTIKQAFSSLKKQGLIKIIKGDKVQIAITELGKNRLNRLIPAYETKRTWDKKIYLITYDIPTKKNRDRDRLRNYLKRLGCALLQESVWVTPYNPKKILAEFVQEKDLSGVVLVSDLGLDGKIGDEDLTTLLQRIYKLQDLNLAYEDFIIQYSQKRNFSLLAISFAFNRILLKDPQLPFALLPKDWKGDKAYILYQKLSRQI